MFMTCMSNFIVDDSWARIVDLFVSSLPISTFGFTYDTLNIKVNTPYSPADLFKLFLYGYSKKIRYANLLAESCIINLEVIWLLKGIVHRHEP